MSHLTLITVIFVPLSLLGCTSAKARIHPSADIAPDEEAAILATIDRFFEAMAARDMATFATLMTPDGMTYSQAMRDGEWRLFRRTNQHMIDTITDGSSSVAETYWEPTVLIRGPIAVVWAPYEFRRNGEISHCGVDVFNMLKIDGKWVIGNAMWTAEPEACEELQPRKGAEARAATRK